MLVRFAVITAVVAISAVGAARAVSTMRPAVAADGTLRPRLSLDAPPATAVASSATSLSKAADGHYWAEADVNGRQVRFLVDTGATEVSLTPDDAARLGFQPASLTYDARVTTANGVGQAARVKLDTVAVAGARVAQVDALVVRNGLSVSLLGMSYLGRLSRIEATPDALILRP